jgi:hypothetical protein
MIWILAFAHCCDLFYYPEIERIVFDRSYGVSGSGCNFSDFSRLPHAAQLFETNLRAALRIATDQNDWRAVIFEALAADEW